MTLPGEWKEGWDFQTHMKRSRFTITEILEIVPLILSVLLEPSHLHAVVKSIAVHRIHFRLMNSQKDQTILIF